MKKEELSREISRLFTGVIIISFVVSSIAGSLGGFFAGWYLGSQKGKTSFSSSPAAISHKVKVSQLQEESATIEAVKKVSPAVVSIIISKDLSKYYNYTGPNIFPFDDFFEFGFPNYYHYRPGKQEIGGGTGFIVDGKRGLILTNKHVVADEEAEYTVITNDGKKYDKVKILAKDPINDLAVLQIEAHDLPQVEFGDSDSLQIGQTVIAIGFALGEYKNTVTKGVISGIGRSIVAGGGGRSEALEGVIQTDAAINPGNSGGPLINLEGQVVGVNTAISQEGQLIGFAIPGNEAKFAYESVRDNGKIIRAFLGVRYILLNKSIAQANNLEVDYGALIVRGRRREDLAIVPGSPADKAGLEENDIILEVDGQKITQEHTLSNTIGRHHPGDEVELKVWHDGQEKTIKVKLGERE